MMDRALEALSQAFNEWAAYEIDEILDQMIEQGIDGIPADVYEELRMCAP